MIKRILASLIILAASISFYLVVEKKFVHGLSNRFINLTARINPQGIDEIIVGKKEGKKWKKWVLKKTKRGWIIDYKYPRPANEKRIEAILKALRDIKGEVRSEKEETLPLFYLTDKQALHIFLKRKHALVAHFLVGKKGPSFGTCFMRLPDSPVVYLVDKDILALFKIFTKDPKFPPEEIFLPLYTDWTVINPDIEHIEKVSVNLKRMGWRLELKGENAVFSYGDLYKKKYTRKEALLFLKKFFPIMSEDIVDPKELKGIKFEGSITVKLSNEKVEKCPLHEERGLDYLLYARRRGFYYLLTKESTDRIINPLKIFSSIQHQAESGSPHQAESRKASDK